MYNVADESIFFLIINNDFIYRAYGCLLIFFIVGVREEFILDVFQIIFEARGLFSDTNHLCRIQFRLIVIKLVPGQIILP